MSELSMSHFEELREKINQRLLQLQTRHAQVQINDFPWLYGALGEVPSEVMFICENPSLSGIRRAQVDTIDGREPDIEAQWWSGRRNGAAKIFRQVLRQTGLKESRPDVRGGWKCYITNVVKEANVAADQDTLSSTERHSQASDWADILAWEFDRVRPKHVFCVGTDAHEAVKKLQRAGLLLPFPIKRTGHYTARGTDEKVMRAMLLPIQTELSGFGALRSRGPA